jgi:hypothetical protein
VRSSFIFVRGTGVRAADDRCLAEKDRHSFGAPRFVNARSADVRSVARSEIRHTNAAFVKSEHAVTCADGSIADDDVRLGGGGALPPFGADDDRRCGRDGYSADVSVVLDLEDESRCGSRQGRELRGLDRRFGWRMEGNGDS